MKRNDYKNRYIKQELLKDYAGHTEKDYCDYLYHKLRSLHLYQDDLARNLTDRNIYCMRAAILQAYANNQDEFYHELADFFRGRGNDMELPVTYTEKSVFLMIYELGTSVLAASAKS